MKILLLGEFSGLHRYLKDGLQELGEEVTLAANGDGWKEIKGADQVLYYSWKGWKRPVSKVWNKLIAPCFSSNDFKGYDVVQVINPYIYNILIGSSIIKKVAKNNKVFSLCAAGEDYDTYKEYCNHRWDYYLYDFDKDVLKNFDKAKLSGKLRMFNDTSIIKIADIIIPCAYEYMLGHKYSKTTEVIPLPINVKEIKYYENRVKDKIVFFHGINRELSKGTPFIREALQKLKNNYPNDVEVIIDGHMPFEKYMDVMKKTNVVLDQCTCYSYGINACVAMAQGKVVMAGNRKEMRNALGIEPPIAEIRPNVEYIYNQLLKIVSQRNTISEWGYQSRKYIEEEHDCVKVADKYIQAWRSTGKL